MEAMMPDQTDLIKSLWDARDDQRQARGLLPTRHPDRRAANGRHQSALRQVVKYDIKVCTTCRGSGVNHAHIAPKVIWCDWCAGTGFDESQNRRGEWTEKTCWKCAGTRYQIVNQYKAIVCVEGKGRGLASNTARAGHPAGGGGDE